MFAQFVVLMKMQDHQDCHFDKYLISEGSCSQQNDSTTIAILESPAMQKRINVNSFKELCVSACTEEGVCICQEIGECYVYLHTYSICGVAIVSYVYSR